MSNTNFDKLTQSHELPSRNDLNLLPSRAIGRPCILLSNHAQHLTAVVLQTYRQTRSNWPPISRDTLEIVLIRIRAQWCRLSTKGLDFVEPFAITTIKGTHERHANQSLTPRHKQVVYLGDNTWNVIEGASFCQTNELAT
jgi:hypothetical protein